MEDSALFDLCLHITGLFEDGLSYQGVTGDFDGEGLSVGILQWNAGAGTLQTLLKAIAETMGWAKMDSFFLRGGMRELANSSPAIAVEICRNRFLLNEDPSKVSPSALATWRSLLAQPESVAAQRALGITETLASAKRMAAFYFPGPLALHPRVIAFFFDLANQEGYMHGVPVAPSPDVSAALQFASTRNPQVAAAWKATTSADPLAKSLLYYAFERTRLGKVAYWWDSLSRRGTIACRYGCVHESYFDLSKELP